jgi:Zn-dependent protease with chaperone function
MVQEQVCPQCSAAIPTDPRYVAWCEGCGWNLQPHQPDRPRTLFAATYAGMGARLGQSLFDELAHVQSPAPGPTRSLILAAALATAVHAVTLLCALLGVWLIWAQWFNVFALLGGVLLIGIAWILLPRPPAYPEHPLPSERFPALYGIADLVADTVQAPQPDALVITTRFNASYSRAGWCRRHVLRLCLPLIAMLDDRQAVALIAHELAHAVNGDATRGLLIGSAVEALSRWYMLLTPTRSMMRTRGIAGLATMVTNLFLHLLSQLVRFIASGMSHLLWHNAQRAEYFADHLAARVAGTEAVLALLDTLQLDKMVDLSVQRTAMAIGSGDLFGDLREQHGAMPAYEWKRLRAIARLEASRLDATHPPTGFRMRLLEARPIMLPTVTLPGTTWRAAQQELAMLEAPSPRGLSMATERASTVKRATPA